MQPLTNKQIISILKENCHQFVIDGERVLCITKYAYTGEGGIHVEGQELDDVTGFTRKQLREFLGY